MTNNENDAAVITRMLAFLHNMNELKIRPPEMPLLILSPQ